MTITAANIDIGDLPNDGTGDPLRVAFDKINNNFEELALLAPTGPTGSFQFKDANALPAGTANFTYDAGNNIINFGGNFIPTDNGNIDIGTSSNRVGNIWLANSGVRLGNITVQESGNTVSLYQTLNPSLAANLVVNDITVNGNLNLENTTFNVFNIITTTNTANQIVFETPASGFNSGTFKIISREESTNNSQSVEIELTKSNDNTYVRMVAYGTTFETPLDSVYITKYNADVGFGNVRLMVSPARNSTTVHTISYQIVNA